MCQKNQLTPDQNIWNFLAFNLLQNDWSIFNPENASNLMGIKRVKATMQSPSIFDQGLRFYHSTLCLHASSLMDTSVNIYFVDIMWFCKGNIKLNSAIFAFGSGLKIPFPFYSRIFQSILKPSKIEMNTALIRWLLYCLEEIYLKCQ